MWFCSVENCKLARSVQHNSSQLANFTCMHVDQVKSNYPQVLPVAVLSPNLDKFVASESVKDSIKELIKDATSCTIELTYSNAGLRHNVLYGPITASNPLGYCHVRKNTDPYPLVQIYKFRGGRNPSDLCSGDPYSQGTLTPRAPLGTIIPWGF